MVRVVVTGLGVLCANASNREEFAAACFAGKSGMKPCTVFPTEGLSTRFFGEVEGHPCASNDRLRELIRWPAQEMLSDANVTREYLASLGDGCRLFLGIFLYNADILYRHSQAKHEGRLRSPNGALAMQDDYSAYVRELLGVRGAVTVASSACASSMAAAGLAMAALRQGLCQCAVVLGADALDISTACGFQALKSLSQGIVNPYDEERDGINIGEAGVALLLEEEQQARRRGAKIYGELSGFALGNDAYHATSPDPSGAGALRTMRDALADAGLSPSDIGCIQGHGTGTRINDAMELKAVGELFCGGQRKTPLWLSSVKAVVGHAMGAAGAIGLAAALLSLREGRYMPLPRLSRPMEAARPIRMASRTAPMEAVHAMANSFAFAGNSASIVVSRWDPQRPVPEEKGVGPLFIRGVGIVSRAGAGAEEILAAFSSLDGASFSSDAPCREFPLGVPPGKVRRCSRYMKLAVAAAAACLEDAGLAEDSYDGASIGTVMATGYGATTSNFQFDVTLVQGDPKLCSPAVFSTMVASSCLGQAAMAFGLKGDSVMLTGGNPLLCASLLLARRQAPQMALCGGVEEYNEDVAASVESFGILPPKTIAEGAAMLLLDARPPGGGGVAVTGLASAAFSGSPYLRRPERREAEELLRRALERLPEGEAPSLVLAQGNGSYFDDWERQALTERYGAVELAFPKRLFGETFGAALSQNVALGALLLRRGLVKGALLATGMDLHGNYMAVRMECLS